MRKFLLLFFIFNSQLFFANGQYNLGGTPGSAQDLGGECFRLTPDAFTQVGTVWFQNKISLASNFTIEANVYLGNRDADGADGLAFVLQPVCSGVGSLGGGLGYAGIVPSLAVELDTWQNNDPPQDHIGLMFNGNTNHLSAPASVPQGFNILPNIENGQNHTFKVEWIANIQNLRVTFDNILHINYTGNIVANIFGGNRNVFWGFTAATGSARNEHRVCITSKSFTEEGSYTITQPTCPSLNNGAIDLNPAGGIGPFTYAWSNGATTEDISGITAGTYSVTVKDANNCTSKYTIDVTNAPDVDPPTIICPQPITVPNDPGQCGAVVKFADPTVSDNCLTSTNTSLVVNGSFESNYSGWTVSSTSPPGGTFGILTTGQVISNGQPLFDYADNLNEIQTGPGLPYTGNPTDGNKLAIFLNRGPGTHRMYQDIMLPNSGPLILSFDLQYRNHAPSFDPNNQFLSVVLRNPVTNAIIATLFKTVIGDPLSIPMTQQTINISAYAGQPVRLEMISATFNNFYFDVLMDNVKISPTQGSTVTLIQTGGLPSGSQFPVGTTSNIFEATDEAGNKSTCSFNVTVNDIEPPTVLCKAVTVNLVNGAAFIKASDVNNVSTDNCGIQSITVSPSTFTCANVGTNTVTLTVTDIHNNTSTCTATVTVVDNEAPTAVCKPKTVALVNGTATITGADVDGGSSDACGIQSLSVSPSTFDCSNVGTNTVTLTVMDVNGNTSTCNAIVTVIDNTLPTAVCKPTTVTLVNGAATITASSVDGGSSDACGIKSLSVSPTNFTCANIGANTVTLTVTDNNNNVSTCTTTVTVVGTIPTCSITSVPSNNTYTGGVSTNLYLGYGPQSTTLQVSAPSNGAPYTYVWSSSPSTGLSSLNLTNPGAPVFTPTAQGVYTFTVKTTNKYGCFTTCSITICVLDIRVPAKGNGNGGDKKVYVCHTPPGNPGNAHTIEVSVNAVPAHIFNPGHGDRLGTCEQTPCGASPITSSSRVMGTNVMGSDALSLTLESVGFKISASPNPSASNFNLRIQSKNASPVQVRVLDVHGRPVFRQSNVSPNTILQIGQNFRTGTYMVEALQGADRQVIKLIKSK